MTKKRGRVTLPSERNFLEETKELMEKWGADAIRDSDGTKLDDDIKDLDAKIYTTYFVARNHNDFIREHMEECQQLFVISDRVTSKGKSLTIDFMNGFYSEQLVPDYNHDPKEWWQVYNRTTGELLATNEWDVDQENHQVIIHKTLPFNVYTVSFLVYKIWDPTQMYNHTTNNWGDSVEHDIPFNVRMPHSNKFMSEYLKQWLIDNPKTDVVRFTTLFYHFTLFFNDLGKEKFVDWFGYGASVSPELILDFEEEYGYRLTAEDFVDEGYYNSSFRIPSQSYLDYVEFLQKYVSQEAKKLVDLVHESGKEAMMFLGDNWIGTEPYGEYFKNIGMDGVVGSVDGGATMRMIADIPHLKYTEGRFLPYFFPDTFYEGNNPVDELIENWVKARRAMMRNPVDRIGYGGYMSLAYKFPDFIEYVGVITDQFREIYDIVKGTKAHTGLKVAILNSWGKLRTWQTHMVAHALPYKQIYSYIGILEVLSGASVDVEFISFDDVIQNGVATDIDVIINAGDAYTAFSGGDVWKNPELIGKIRQFVYEGGGFVGVGEPSAVEHHGAFFQLSDVLGVDKELSFSLSTDKYFHTPVAEHFITADLGSIDEIKLGEVIDDVYALSEETEIIEYSDGEVHLAANTYGQGRSVYISGLPYSFENTRLLIRSLYYAANKEKEMFTWYSSNPKVEVNAYPEKGKYAIVNNTNELQHTIIYDGEQKEHSIQLEAGEIRWEEI